MSKAKLYSAIDGALYKAPVPYWLGSDAERHLHNERRGEGESELATQSGASKTITRAFITPAAPGSKGEVVTVTHEAETQEYATPVPYYEAGNLSPTERRALEKERDELTSGLDGMAWVERTRAEVRIGEIERLLKSDRFDREVERRQQERATERRQQSGNAKAGARTAQFFAAQGRQTKVMQGLYGPVVMVF